jgi:hypothetical protein
VQQNCIALAVQFVAVIKTLTSCIMRPLIYHIVFVTVVSLLIHKLTVLVVVNVNHSTCLNKMNLVNLIMDLIV